MALPSSLSRLIKAGRVEIVDLRFTDLLGVWQHASAPISELEGILKIGMGFDGSSIRGFQDIYNSDLVLVPDVSTAHVDPFLSVPTVSLICDVRDPDKNTRYTL
jgi:glutamine synthetase